MRLDNMKNEILQFIHSCLLDCMQYCNNLKLFRIIVQPISAIGLKYVIIQVHICKDWFYTH